MGCKECLGRYGLLACSIIFCIGMIVSTSTPQWISTEIKQSTKSRTVTEFGPFYSRSQDCVVVNLDSNFEPIEECTKWEQTEIGEDDCGTFLSGNQDQDLADKICRQHNTWRYIAMCCMFIVVVTSVLVAVATFTQCLTCGCCGGSFDYLASIAYWIEVGLSIVAWSFAISVVMLIRGETFQGLVESEAEEIEELEDIAKGSFLWGFWLFAFTGTIVGMFCATFASWAADGSILSCLTCCCRK